MSAERQTSNRSQKDRQASVQEFMARHYASLYHTARLGCGRGPIRREYAMKKMLVAITLGALLSGCAVTKDWSATGGSRADGVVRLSYDSGEMETVRLNEAQAVKLAAQRCRTWGYAGAEAFGGVTRQCSQLGGLSGCARWMVTKEFQCTGTGAEVPMTGRTAAPYSVATQNSSPAPVRQSLDDSRAVAPASTVASTSSAGVQEAENARIALASAGCQAAKSPVRFKQQHDTSFYEARCTDGRLVHALCTFGDCRLRTRDD